MYALYVIFLLDICMYIWERIFFFFFSALHSDLVFAIWSIFSAHRFFFSTRISRDLYPIWTAQSFERFNIGHHIFLKICPLTLLPFYRTHIPLLVHLPLSRAHLVKCHCETVFHLRSRQEAGHRYPLLPTSLVSFHSLDPSSPAHSCVWEEEGSTPCIAGSESWPYLPDALQMLP